VKPRFVRSERTRGVLAAGEDAVAKGIPLGRVWEGTNAAWITGHTLIVDGGKLLLRG
jgi:hypothetical protein